MKDLLAFAAIHNLSPPSLDLDGKIHRFDRGGKKNAWYVGWQHHTVKLGETYIVAVFGDWKTGEQFIYKPNKKLTREDNAVIKRCLEEAKAREIVEREIKNREAAEKARNMLKIRANQHPYLEKKKIQPHGTFIEGTTLLIPMQTIDGDVWGVQRIFSDGQKRFLTGQKTTGLMYCIQGSDIVFICEGFATGASIHEATGGTVYCSFSAHNLPEVAKSVRKIHTTQTLVIAADDDRNNPKNSGREAGEKAAMIAMARVSYPTVGTDFNDVHCELGLDAVRSQLQETESTTTGYVPLGYDSGEYYFYKPEYRNIIRISSFVDHQMLALMPLNHWQEAYPGKKGINWIAAKDDLIRACSARGVYNPMYVRGTGVWLDDGMVKVNDGHTQPESKRHVYIQTKNRMMPISDNPLCKEEAAHLAYTCCIPKWNDAKSGPLLAGWIAIARVAGALPVRPHIWVTGESGSGKSTVMEDLINNALGDKSSRVYAQGGSTEAGIRQSIRADSVPLIFDEFETDARNDRTEGIKELLRQAWSYTSGGIIKGSGTGAAEQYQQSFAACLSSIRVRLDKDSDRARISVLELNPHGSDEKHYQQLLDALKVITPEYGERLFARSVNSVQNIITSYGVLRKIFASKHSQRFGQQYGMLLAGYWSLVSDDTITDSDAVGLIDKHFRPENIHSDDSPKDHDECLDHLLSTRVEIQESVHPYKMLRRTMGELLKNTESYTNHLIDYGVRVEGEEIFIANSHAELGKIYKGTRWDGCWSKALCRISGAKANEQKRIGGKNRKCVKILINQPEM